MYYGITSFINILKNKYVCSRSDSTTAVSSANKMGSSSSQVDDLIMRDLWTFCTEQIIWLTVHIYGVF